MNVRLVASQLRKILAIIGPAHHRTMLVLLVMMTFSSFLEVAGIGLVLPVTMVLVSPAAVTDHEALRRLDDALGNPHPQTLSLLLLGSLAAGYLLKNLFRVFQSYSQSRFAFQQQAAISERLYRGYLSKNYDFHLRRNSAELIRNITTETDLFSLLVLLPALLIGAELCVLTAVSGFLFFVAPKASLAIVVTFGGSVLAFYVIVQRRLVRWGAARQHHDLERIRQAQQALGGIKDVKVLGREDFFIAEFAVHAKERSLYEGRSFFLGQLPVVWLETVALATVVAVFSTFVLQGASLTTILPTLAVFAGAALRLMPSLSKVLNAGQQLRYCKPVIDTLYSEITSNPEGQILTESSPRARVYFQGLQVEGLSYRYPGTDADVLCRVSFALERGQCIGVIGTSGSGKTTLVDLILGLLRPTEGDIRANGTSIHADCRAWQSQVGYVPQTIYLADQTLRENVAFGIPASRIDDKAVARAVGMAQLQGLIDSLPLGLATVVGERGVRLSGGQRQRVGLARALYHDPDVLVLDEATSALDSDTEFAVMEAVRSLSGEKTLVVIAHRLTTVAACDVVHRLENGRIVWSGTLETAEMQKPG